MGMAEEQGFGLANSLKRQAEKLNLPLPSFAMAGDYLVLTIYRSRNAAVSMLQHKVREQLSKAELDGWQWIATKGTAKSSQYARDMQVENRTARRHLNHFEALGLVRKTGSGPSTKYEVI